jgi:hypothetical protein
MFPEAGGGRPGATITYQHQHHIQADAAADVSTYLPAAAVTGVVYIKQASKAPTSTVP